MFLTVLQYKVKKFVTMIPKQVCSSFKIKVTFNNNYKRLEPYLDKGFLIFVVYFGSTNFRIFFIRSLSQLVSLVPEVDNCCRKVLRLQFITFLT